ncbi:DEAD/DEAH box helicase, partial [Paenibacillus gorillae]|uniref:DEAD/DEAH box helicase n=1 Tax=Paenibacillus gorillae TaxID=1243662 RepID=UPI001EE34C5F
MERKAGEMKAFVGGITVDGFWSQLEDELQGSIMLATAERQESALRLRSVLFAWHKSSWYGTEVEEMEQNGRKMLKLPPLIAVDYLSAPQHARLLRVEWSDRLQRLMAIASLIREALLGGWFEPEWSRWSEQRRAWRIAWPETEPERESQWAEFITAATGSGDIGIEQWLSDAIEQMLAGGGEASEAWRQVGIAAGGETILERKSGDEEDWLIAIGLRKDSLPFKTALQLVEPGETSFWRLRPALQDRNGGPWIPIIQSGEQWVTAPDTNAGYELEPLPEEWQPLLSPKLEKEQAKWLAALPEWADEEKQGDIKRLLSDNEAWAFMEKASITLLEAGCPVLLPSWWEAVRSRKLRLRAKMKSSVGSEAQPMFGLDQIVQFDWRMALGNVDLSESDFMRLAEENRRLMNIGGEWVHLDPHDVAQIRDWMKRVGKRKGLSFRDVMEMHLLGGSPLGDELDDTESLRAEVELNEHLAKWLEQLQHTTEIPLVEKPASFLGELRPYQQQGVSWMLFLRRFGLGGCLADDMGLGKTIQFMAYLTYIKEQKTSNGHPSLLICPTSVIGNWQKELEKFAPSLRVYLHYGPKRDKGEAFESAVHEADIVITSYSLAQLDEEDLRLVEWDALCLDEAQNIKNVYTKQSTAIRSLPAYHRLALTGTP